MKNRDRCEMKGNPKGTLKQGKLVYSVFRPRAPALQCLDVFWAPGSCPGASSLVVCALGWYLLRPRWVPCWSALAALVAGDVV